ncbi:hypothetical protein TVAG_406410 [Trichomonas vaginalis G3]|uniref:Uncharacterized protein n=1 Tax=Trichomonas vaginalis (strain ATCC PRA-98 / G3) TaxID=412133 RepID=A2FNZ7_TRIV3|nr:phosphatidylinositol-3,5-bisphosphate binding [Trichomonas vaginalis G3]EAX93377.1 hypothetical protein TVAG_406410 [Trichomonas vaginalis G3]KAI5509793.1 phosphatidylinositol-3,5-bisphosphate binding [Trichomonas vaginalis G3]|eukprot:XP_001306307.1 hypothetical protein [Trichomonas vaginalis G3]
MNEDEINSITFDPFTRFIGVSMKDSVAIYSVEPLKRTFKKDFLNFKIGHITISPDGNTVVFTAIPTTGDTQQHKVYIYSTYFDEAEKQLDFGEPILNIVLRKNHILIILANSICAYDIRNKVIYYEQITSPNIDGAGDISLDDQNPIIAVCGLIPGSIRVSFMSDESPVLFNAHEHAISIIRFSNDASLLATASCEGTIIRLFDSATGSPLKSFRRGNIPAKILSAAISPGNGYLSVFSSNGTVHIFQADSRVEDINDPPRAATKISIGICNSADLEFNSDSQLRMVSSTGFLYEIDPKKGIITSKTFILSH